MLAFEWDERKRAANLAKHGIDFVDAAQAMEKPAIVRPDDRRDYGEARYTVIARQDDAILTIVCTYREDRCRIISARRANARERATYRSLRPEEA